MKYILLTLAMALIVAVTSCENGKVELPVGDTGTDTVDTDETVGIDTTVKDTADTEDASDTEDITASDTTAEVTTVMESTESQDTSETQDTSADYADIQSIIDENLDILSSDPYSSKSEQEVIDTYPDNFSAIVSLGKAALPYLEQCASDTDNAETMSDTLRAIIARNAAYSIDPSLYDLVFESPDGKSRIIASVRAFADDHARNPEITYGKLSLDNAGSTRQIESSEFNFTDVNVAWSDDSGYAVIFGTQKEDRFPVIALFVDTAAGSLVSLPSLDIYNYILEKEPDLKSFLSVTARSCKWDSGNPTIEFELSVGAAFYPQVIHGQYTFDAKTHEMKDVIYDLSDVKISDVTLTDEEIRKVVDKNLDVLAKDSNAWVTEEEMINAHPDAFKNIVSLGSSALPYLNEIKEENILSANNRWVVAEIAMFVINPTDQDKTFFSPDGKYILKAFDNNTDTPTEIMDYNLIVISDATTETSLYISQKTYRNICVAWDTKCGYVMISHGISGYFRDVDIIDIQNSVLLDLPEVNDIRMLLATKAVKENVGEYDKYVIQLTDVSDNIAKFRFAFSNPNFPDQISGRYSYDIERSVITDFYVVSENISDWMIP